MRKFSKILIMIMCVAFFTSCGGNVKEEKGEFKKFDENLKLLENDYEKLFEDEIKNNPKKDINIVLDPGHSKNPMKGKEKVSPDSNEMKLKETSGATGIKSKESEPDTAMKIVLEVQKMLLEKGYNVSLTKRTAEESISNIERANIGNKENADLLIRIHCDSFTNGSARGASMLIPTVRGYMNKETADKSKVYGEKIFNSYLKETGLKSRGLVYKSDLTGFNWSKVPVVLLEMGFISNEEEDLFIQNKDNHQKIAKGIVDGIEACFSNN